MTSPAIEPGLLRVFRWYVAIRLGFGLLSLWVVSQEADAANPRFPGWGVFFFGLLAVLLFVPPAQRRLGRWFLPLALSLATVGPIAESAANIGGRLDAGLGPNEALADYWLPFFLLWVPLLMIAWQYRYRAVIVFAVVSSFLDLVLTVPPLEEAGADITIVGALIFARGLLFAFVGLFVVKLVGGQKEARKALATHAATLEQLATSRERNRLARELHDTLAHSLSATAVQLEAVRSLWDQDPERAKHMLEQSLERARGGLSEARRAIQSLRASPLEEHGLEGALEHMAGSLRARSSLEVEVHVGPDLGTIAPEVEQAVYRIADEALTNTSRHAEADRADLYLWKRGRQLILEVRDDGRGFDTTAAVPNGHVGLRGMRERAAMVGGAATIASTPGDGTIVRFEVPAG